MLLHASCLNPGVLSLLPRSRNEWEPLPTIKPCASLGTQHFRRLCAASSSPLLDGKQGSLFQSIPKLPQRRQRPLVPRASNDVACSYRYPWWLRILACLPYLIPLHNIAETGNHLNPVFLTYPFLEALGRLPIWFALARFFIAFLVIPRKELPHFFRFHVLMGVLLEIVVQVIKTVNRFVYCWVKRMHSWTDLEFAFLLTVLACMMCALAGMYSDGLLLCLFCCGMLRMHFWTGLEFAFLFTVLACMRCALDGRYSDGLLVCKTFWMLCMLVCKTFWTLCCGMLGIYSWTGLDFVLLFMVLECMMCALAGMYADVPFVSDAAYIQSD